MKERKFQVGDYVKFKTYEDLLNEFGLMDKEQTEGKEVINCEFGCTSEFLSQFNDHPYYKIEDISQLGFIVLRDKIFEGYVSTDMLTLMTEEEQEKLILWKNDADFTSQLKEIMEICRVWSYEDTFMKFTPEINVLLFKELFSTLLPSIHHNTQEKNPLVLNGGEIEGNIANNITNYFVNSEDLFTDAIFIDIISSKTERPLIELGIKQLNRERLGILNIESIESGDFIKIYNIEFENRRHILFFCENINADVYAEIYEQTNYILETNIPAEAITALKKKDKKEFCKVYNPFAERIIKELKEAELQKSFEIFAEKATRDHLGKLRRNLDDRKYEVQEALNIYKNKIKSLHEIEERLMGARYGKDIEEQKNNIIDMLYSNIDDIEYFKVNDGFLDAVVRQRLLYWDEDHFQELCENGFFFFENEKLTTLCKEIFEKRSVTLLLLQGFTFHFSGSDFRSYSIDMEGKIGIPNPHMERYNCWGDNTSEIHRCLEYGDFLGAFAQIRSAIAGLNMYDPDVMREFKIYLADEYTDNKCLLLSDGRLISIQEYCNRENGEEE